MTSLMLVVVGCLAVFAVWQSKIWLTPPPDLDETVESQLRSSLSVRLNTWIENPDEQTLKEIEESLVSEDVGEVRMALIALDAIVPALQVDPDLVKACLRHPDPTVRIVALTAWVAIHRRPADTVVVLLSSLSDESAEIRDACLAMITQIGNDAGPIIVQELETAPVMIRDNLFQCLAKLEYWDERAVTLARLSLQELLDDGEVGALNYLLASGKADVEEIELGLLAEETQLHALAIAAAALIGKPAQQLADLIDTRIDSSKRGVLEYEQLLSATGRDQHQQSTNSWIYQSSLQWRVFVLGQIDALPSGFVDPLIEQLTSVTEQGSFYRIVEQASLDDLARWDGRSDRVASAVVMLAAEFDICDQAAASFIRIHAPELIPTLTPIYVAQLDSDKRRTVNRAFEILCGLQSQEEIVRERVIQFLKNPPLNRNSHSDLQAIVQAGWYFPELTLLLWQWLDSDNRYEQRTAMNCLAIRPPGSLELNDPYAERIQASLLKSLVRELDYAKVILQSPLTIPTDSSGEKATEPVNDVAIDNNHERFELATKEDTDRILSALSTFEPANEEFELLLRRCMNMQKHLIGTEPFWNRISLTPEDETMIEVGLKREIAMKGEATVRAIYVISKHGDRFPAAWEALSQLISGDTSPTPADASDSSNSSLPVNASWWASMPNVLTAVQQLGPKCERLRPSLERLSNSLEDTPLISLSATSSRRYLPLSERLIARKRVRIAVNEALLSLDRATE